MIKKSFKVNDYINLILEDKEIKIMVRGEEFIDGVKKKVLKTTNSS